MTSKYDPPEESVHAPTIAFGRAALAAVPVLGGSANELISYLIAPTIERRKNEWMSRVGEGLQRLEEKLENFNLDDLMNKEGFASSFFQASREAIATHQEEKIAAFRNVVLNSAIEHSTDQDRILMFINLTSRYTAWHFRLISYFDNPRLFLERRKIDKDEDSLSMMAFLSLFGSLFEGEEFDPDIVKICLQELIRDGLINKFNLTVSAGIREWLNPKITRLGKELLQFISEPRELTVDTASGS